MRTLVRAAEVLTLPVGGLAVGLAVAPARAELWVHLFLVAVVAVALAAAVRLLRGAEPGRSAFEAALRREPARAERLPELARLEREVTLASSSAFDVHFRLRPLLRELAGGLLAARRGIALDGEPARAQAALGEETWELVRADREPPRDRYGPGIPPDRLRRVVESLEAL